MKEKLFSIPSKIAKKLHQVKRIKFVDREFPLTLKKELSVWSEQLWSRRSSSNELDQPNVINTNDENHDKKGSDNIQAKRDRLYSQVDGLLSRKIFNEENANNIEDKIRECLVLMTLDKPEYHLKTTSQENLDYLEDVVQAEAYVSGMRFVIGNTGDNTASIQLSLLMIEAKLIGIRAAIEPYRQEFRE